MATLCRAQDRTTCEIHGMGGLVERLAIDKGKAMRTGNFEEQFNIQRQIETLEDEDPNAPDIPKDSFFAKLGLKLLNRNASQ